MTLYCAPTHLWLPGLMLYVAFQTRFNGTLTVRA